MELMRDDATPSALFRPQFRTGCGALGLTHVHFVQLWAGIKITVMGFFDDTLPPLPACFLCTEGHDRPTAARFVYFLENLRRGSADLFEHASRRS